MVSSVITAKATIGASADILADKSLAGGISPTQLVQSLPDVNPLARAAFDQYFQGGKANTKSIEPPAPIANNEPITRDISRLNPENPTNNAGDTILNSLYGVNTNNQTNDYNRLFDQMQRGYLSDNPVFVLDLQVALANFTINNQFQRKISSELNAQTKQIIQEQS